MPKTHTLHCQDPWFTLIKEGKKPVEGRKDNARFRDWKVGDTIVFTLGDASFRTRIAYIHRYASIEDYLNGETLARALPGVPTLEEGVRIYLQWSTREEVAERGFVGIGVELISF